MTKKPVISSAQLLYMSVGSALVFPYTFMPILSAPPANQDAWIVLIMAAVYIFAFSLPLLFLMNKFRGMNTNEMTEITLGKYFGKVAAVIFALFFIYCFTACMLITAVFINLYIFPETPTWALLLYMVVPVSYASYKGAGTIGRMAIFIVPFVILTIIIFFVIGLGAMDLGELQPVLADSTFIELNEGAFLTGARYSEVLIFLVFSFWLKQKSSINKTFTAAICVYAVCFFLILLPTLTVLGVELGKHVWDPYFVYTRQIKAYDFIERVQSLNILSWFPATLLKLMMYSFMGSYLLSGVVKAKSHKGFVIPISILGYSLCLIPVINKVSTIEFLRSDRVFPFVVLPVTLVLPVILVIVFFIRRKRIKAILDQKKKEIASST